ncbi:RNA polymerase sigma factor [Saccharicrinis fermentans]|uniref:Sigma-24 n=1 Tax=Saccharicrinis fermentans DSM 9555 = JCM 21142 TaxID=869213 RepID=W7YH34_9BACT|nr:RNA polymerase sigma-70 factor [Saccharicrinis fermentans]GAF03711.1 sigma-24 [Saccharicrinis fermentans DSM 9555 = JCM 21142]
MDIPTSNISKSILEQFKAGNTKAFDTIYGMLSKRLCRFVRYSINNNEDVQEIVQEVFIKLWNERENLNLNKSFEAFVFTITKNKIHDYLRKTLQEKKYIESIIQNYSFQDNELEDIVNFRETDATIKKLIGMLPERRRKAFVLSRFGGKSYREISALMDISENTVDTHIRKALTFLKEGLIRFSSFIFFL